MYKGQANRFQNSLEQFLDSSYINT